MMMMIVNQAFTIFTNLSYFYAFRFYGNPCSSNVRSRSASVYIQPVCLQILHTPLCIAGEPTDSTMRVLPGDDADAALDGELMRRCGTDCGRGGGGRVNAERRDTPRYRLPVSRSGRGTVSGRTYGSSKDPATDRPTDRRTDGRSAARQRQWRQSRDVMGTGISHRRMRE